MNALHENPLKQHHSATAIHFDEKSIVITNRRRIFSAKNIKILALTVVWLVITVIFIVKPEHHLTYRYLHIPPQIIKTVSIEETLDSFRLDVHLMGAFSKEATTSTLTLYAAVNNGTKRVSEYLNFSLVDVNNFETVEPTHVSEIVTLSETLTTDERADLQLSLSTNCNATFTLSWAYAPKPMSVEAGIGIGAAVLLGLYILIISEVVDRTFASLIVSTLSVAALALFNERPDLEEIMHWVDMDTLMLLFGMMILVAITSETGFFDYMAVFVFKKTKGKTWPLICSLSIVSMVSALVLDSVSTVLLMTPVIIRICEVTNLNPVQVLTIMILAVNIGSTASPVGNPPNVMIINHAFIKESGIGFLDFVLHVLPGVLILTGQSFAHIRYFTFRNIATLQNAEPVEVSTIKHELKMWQNTERSISAISKFDDISRGVIRSRVLLLNEALERELQESHERTGLKNVSYYLSFHGQPHASFHAPPHALESQVFQPNKNGETMNEYDAHEELTRRLEEMYPIKNKDLLIHCGIAFFVVVCFFFLHAVPYFENLSLGWASLLGVCLLLIISNQNDDIKASLLMVEWSSLLFFATLYVLMESLTKIGLIQYVGNQMSNLVEMASIDNRHTAAVLLVLWVSTLISAFLDNIPLTSMMTKVIATLSTSLNLPAGPMVWALAFGCGIGGNGTLIASSSNLVCIGVAEQHGYKFSFLNFMKIGLPLLLTNGLVVSLYLYLHVLFEWYN